MGDMIKIMEQLWEGPKSAGELAANLVLSPSYITKIIEKLQMEGFLVKPRNKKKIMIFAI